jgi:phenylacetaldehyde dehydrogenase
MAVEELAPEVAEFTGADHRLLVGGDWLPAATGRSFETIDPATGEAIAAVPAGDEEDVDRAVRAAREALRGPWSRTTPQERGRLLWRLADLIERDREQFAQIDALDTGKPINEVRYFDIPFSLDVLRYMAGWTTKIHGETIPLSFPVTEAQSYHAYTLREPLGVVGAIIPWNFPLMMAVKKLAPALAAGCTVVLKPAEQTPLSAFRLGALVLEAGIPEGVVNVVTGYGETAGAALVRHPGVDKVAFTGSIETGREIVRAAAGNLKKVMLELGGKAPMIVFADADLDGAIESATFNAYVNQGESCIATARLYVERDALPYVADGVAESARRIKLGPGLDPDTQMGPLVSEEHLERVSGYLRAGEQEGARALTGGRRHGERGYFVEPTVLVDATDAMRVAREEIFGPVLTALPFEDEPGVTRAANALPYGLGASVWTRDGARAQRMARAIESGMVWVNCYGIADAALPFGGSKQSGWGRETCKENVLDYTEAKVVVEPF